MSRKAPAIEDEHWGVSGLLDVGGRWIKEEAPRLYGPQASQQCALHRPEEALTNESSNRHEHQWIRPRLQLDLMGKKTLVCQVLTFTLQALVAMSPSQE